MTCKIVEAQDLSNEEYHSSTGYSSSQLKDALHDVELFHKKYILKEIERKEIPAFAVGTYYHTAILEPELLEKECAVFTGSVRRGAKWEEFKALNEGKTLITKSDAEKAQTLIKATLDSPRAMEILEGGTPELSCFTELMGQPVRVRADKINLNKGFMLDLKSTTGNTKDVFLTSKKISEYSYDLSAALYLDAFNTHPDVNIRDFYWVFASKDFANCKVYKASREMIELGRLKYRYALKQINKYSKLNWVFPDEIGKLSPAGWEVDKWKTANNSQIDLI